MKITVTIEADSYEEFVSTAARFNGLAPAPGEYDIPPSVQEMMAEPNPAPEEIKPRRKHRATNGSRGGKVPEPSGEPDYAGTKEEEPEDIGDTISRIAEAVKEEPTVDETYDKARAAREAIDMQKLKESQLDRLKDLFVAGKGALVRELLKKHGNGAKVFPEVDASRFLDIKKDLDRELGK